MSFQYIAPSWIKTDDNQLVNARYVYRLYLRAVEPIVHPQQYHVTADLPGMRINLTRALDQSEALRRIGELGDLLTHPLMVAEAHSELPIDQWRSQ